MMHDTSSWDGDDQTCKQMNGQMYRCPSEHEIGGSVVETFDNPWLEEVIKSEPVMEDLIGPLQKFLPSNNKDENDSGKKYRSCIDAVDAVVEPQVMVCRKVNVQTFCGV